MILIEFNLIISICESLRKDRVTIQERENQMLKERELEIEVKKLAEERRKQTLRVSKPSDANIHESMRFI